MPNLSLPELLIILVVVLVLFGPKRLPGLGRQLGKGIHEFRESLSGGSRDDDDDERPAARPRLDAPASSAGTADPAARERSATDAARDAAS